MKRLTLSLIGFLFLIISVPISPVQKAEAAKFGSTPLDDVLYWAGQYKSTAGLTSTEEFAAIMLTVTWPEIASASNTDLTPSPMGQGRSDNKIGNGYQLWVDGKTGYDKFIAGQNYYRRVHWTAGVGVFQFDSAGLGKGLSFKQVVNTYDAAKIAAKTMADQYKGKSGTAAEKRAAAWTGWYGCVLTAATLQKCQDIFSSIYQNSKLVVTKDTSVDSMGGLASRTCAHQTSSYTSPSFTCYKFNDSVATGYKGYWASNVEGTPNGMTPLPAPFYSYTSSYYDSSTGTTKYREHRHFLKSDSGYTMSREGIWEMNQNARSGVTWSQTESALIQQ